MKTTQSLCRQNVVCVFFLALCAMATILTLSAPAHATPPDPVPYITSLSSVSVAPGGADFTLTVNGVNFESASTVNWGTTALVTTYVSAKQLTAVVPASLIVSSGSGWITVANSSPHNVSNLVFLPVSASSPQDSFATFTLTAGAGAVGVAQGDFNGDGNLDLVTANWSANTLSIFLSNGDGTFQSPQNISVSTRPVGVSVGDFNHDGNLDLVVGFESSVGVAIFLGNGDGTFQSAHTYAAGSDTYEFAVGDFNGDGALDIAVTNYGSSTIHVLLGNGDGTFQTAVSYAVNSSGFYVHEADLNGDGFLDLVVGDYFGTNVSVLLGNGDGTFQAQHNYAGAPEASDVAIGDFNGDGIPDLITTSQTDNNVYFLAGNGDGTFQTAQAVPIGFESSVIATGDFNADGKLDLASIKGGGGVAVMLGNGDGTFQAAQSFSGAAFTYGILIGNYNTGGGLAIATTDFNSGVLDVLLPTLSISPSSIDFGNQAVGGPSAPQSVTITNSTSQALTLSGITFTGANGSDFQETDNCGTSLASGASCTVQVTFTPGATGARSATINIADNAPASPQTVSLTGTGTSAPVANLSLTSLTFSSQIVGATSSSQVVTLSNPGLAALTGISLAFTGTNPADFGQTNNCGSSVAPSGSCTINVTFTPSIGGAESASLQITDNAGNSPQSITLTGTGVVPAPVANIAPGSLSFGSQNEGTTSSSQSTMLSNTGNATLTGITISIAGTNASDFPETTNCGSSLAASASCSINVAFSPSIAGAESATLRIQDNASGSPQSVTLTGTGNSTTAPSYSVTANPSSLSIQAGQSASSTITVLPVGGYSGTVQLSCTGLPAASTCVFQPAQLTLNGSNTSVSSQLTLSTTASSASSVFPPVASGPHSGRRSGPRLPGDCTRVDLPGAFSAAPQTAAHLRPAMALFDASSGPDGPGGNRVVRLRIDCGARTHRPNYDNIDDHRLRHSHRPVCGERGRLGRIGRSALCFADGHRHAVIPFLVFSGSEF